MQQLQSWHCLCDTVCFLISIYFIIFFSTSLSFTNNDHWLGVTRACASSAPTSASSFRFLDGNVPTYSSWGATEPNNNVVNGIQESCVSSFITSSQWYDISCENSFQFACQYRPSTGKKN